MREIDEVELEEHQHIRLLSAFQRLLTYYDREKVIRFCEETLAAEPAFSRNKE